MTPTASSTSPDLPLTSTETSPSPSTEAATTLKPNVPRSQQTHLADDEHWRFDPNAVAYEGEVVILDTETTGLDHKTESLLEIGAVKLNAEGDIIERFSLLVKPSVPIRPSSQRIHNISSEMVEDAPTVAEALPLFEAFIGDRPYVAHNVVFDYSFITEAYKKHFNRRFLNPRICSLELFKSVFPEEESHSLSSLLHRFGYDSYVSHRALDDAENLAKVYTKLRRLYLQKNAWNYSQLNNVGYLLERYLRLQKAAHTLQSEMSDIKDIFKLYFMEGGVPLKASTGELLSATLKRQYEYDNKEVLRVAEEHGLLKQLSKVNVRQVDRLIYQLEKAQLSEEPLEEALTEEVLNASQALAATRTGMTQQWSVSVGKPAGQASAKESSSAEPTSANETHSNANDAS
jgi:DNA polymerase III epsilon subunit family exonuclease